MGWFTSEEGETDRHMRKHKEGPYSLPPEDNGDPKSVYVEQNGSKYRIATLPDFVRLRDACLSDEGWTEKFVEEGKIAVYDRPAPEGAVGASLNQVKVINHFKSVSAMTLYNALHDPDFRKTWDTNMIEGFNICQLDPRNDIGYYSANFPWPLANREFINMRYWMEFSNGEFIIANRSVVHDDYPVTDKYVRALSYFTGYYISPMNGSTDANSKGCRMIYYTHSDPGGSIPHSLINFAYTKGCPSMMEKLETNASRYEDWCKEVGRDDQFVGPWRTAKVAWDGVKNENAVSTVSSLVKQASNSGIDELEGSGQAANGSNGNGNKQNGISTNGDDFVSPLKAGDVEEKQGDTLTPVASPVVSQGLLLPDGESSIAPAARPASLNTEELQKLTLQLAEYKKKIRGLEQTQLLSGEGASLAPAGPSNKDSDPESVQQFRAMVEDALNFLDRQYIHKGKAPESITEYLTRLQTVVDGVRRSLLQA